MTSSNYLRFHLCIFPQEESKQYVTAILPAERSRNSNETSCCGKNYALYSTIHPDLRWTETSPSTLTTRTEIWHKTSLADYTLSNITWHLTCDTANSKNDCTSKVNARKHDTNECLLDTTIPRSLTASNTVCPSSSHFSDFYI